MVAAKARARGWEGAEGELGQVIGSVRRQLSCTFIRAQAIYLQDAAKRGDDATTADTARHREAQAHWQAHTKGRAWAG